MPPGELAEASLARAIAQRYPADAARALVSCEPAEVGSLLGELPAAAAAQVMSAMATGAARRVAATMQPPALAAILAEMPVSRAATAIRGADPAHVDAALSAMSAAARDRLRRALAHPPGTLGAITDPASSAMPAGGTVGEARSLIRAGSLAGDRVYLVDGGGALIGVIGAAELMAQPDHRRLDEIMVSPVVSIELGDDVYTAAGHAGWSKWRTLPVTERGVLVGVVRFVDLAELTESAPPAASPLSLPLELAELVWLGLAGMTDGLARAVLAEPDEEPRD